MFSDNQSFYVFNLYIIHFLQEEEKKIKHKQICYIRKYPYHHIDFFKLVFILNII